MSRPHRQQVPRLLPWQILRNHVDKAARRAVHRVAGKGFRKQADVFKVEQDYSSRIHKEVALIWIGLSEDRLFRREIDGRRPEFRRGIHKPGSTHELGIRAKYNHT